MTKTIKCPVSIHNRFDIEVLDSVTGEVKQRARAFNVICDGLWTRLLHVGNYGWYPWPYFNYILFGDGEGTPSHLDTELFHKIGHKEPSSPVSQIDMASGVAYTQRSITLQPAEYVDDTITEVGIGYSATGLATHAMLEDMNGNPISITKTNTDIINIYATIYLHFPAAGWSNGAIFLNENFANTDFNSSYKFIALNVFTGVVGNDHFRISPRASSHVLAHNDTGYNMKSYATVNSAAKKLSATMRFEAEANNFPYRYFNVLLTYDSSMTFCGGLCGMYAENWYTPAAITGEAIGTGDGVTTTFRTAFPVKTVGTVYVDGAAAAGATMRAGPVDLGEMIADFRPVHTASTVNALIYTLLPEGLGMTTSGDYTVLYVSRLASAVSSGVLENPYHAIGVTSFVMKKASSGTNQITIHASDDLTTWSEVCADYSVSGSGWATLNVPAALQTKRFFRFSVASNNSVYVRAIGGDGSANNITFTTPPAAGAVITAGYTPDCVAKDSNHVFDLSIEISLNEYQGV